VPPTGYFEKIGAVLKKYDVLLVADEVICGFGRTGNYWGTETLNMKPDIVTCAKALSAAYMPISATIVSQKVFRPIAEESHRIGTFGHGYTYSGHPVPAAVAIEAMKIYDETNIVEHAREVGAYMHEGIRRRFVGHELVGEIRGVGLIGAIELVADKATKENFDPALKIGARWAKLGEDHGVICRGLPNDSLAFSPPLIITTEEVDEMLDGVARALDDLTVQIRRERLAVV
jgi:4-aminobutyrate--pyruvate transaminase